eukprot:3103928-Rhodomonas_salina.5
MAVTARGGTGLSTISLNCPRSSRFSTKEPARATPTPNGALLGAASRSCTLSPLLTLLELFGGVFEHLRWVWREFRVERVQVALVEDSSRSSAARDSFTDGV